MNHEVYITIARCIVFGVTLLLGCTSAGRSAGGDKDGTVWLEGYAELRGEDGGVAAQMLVLRLPMPPLEWNTPEGLARLWGVDPAQLWVHGGDWLVVDGRSYPGGLRRPVRAAGATSFPHGPYTHYVVSFILPARVQLADAALAVTEQAYDPGTSEPLDPKTQPHLGTLRLTEGQLRRSPLALRARVMHVGETGNNAKDFGGKAYGVIRTNVLPRVRRVRLGDETSVREPIYHGDHGGRTLRADEFSVVFPDAPAETATILFQFDGIERWVRLD